MVSAQPSNQWVLKNCRFEAYALASDGTSNGTAVNFVDVVGNDIGSQVYTDSNGFVYAQNTNQQLLGAFVNQPTYIKAFPNGSNTSIDYTITGQFSSSFVEAPNGNILFNSSNSRGWGAGYPNRGTTSQPLLEGKVSFNDISDVLDVSTQIPSNSIDASQLVQNSITDLQISDTANIDGNKLANRSIAGIKLQTNSITYAHLTTGSVSMPILSTDVTSNFNIKKSWMTTAGFSGVYAPMATIGAYVSTGNTYNIGCLGSNFTLNLKNIPNGNSLFLFNTYSPTGSISIPANDTTYTFTVKRNDSDDSPQTLIDTVAYGANGRNVVVNYGYEFIVFDSSVLVRQFVSNVRFGYT